MPDDTKVFDVSKPGKSAPQPTSRPVITNNSPVASDPMVTEDTTPTSSSTSIPISGGDDEEKVNVSSSVSASVDEPNTSTAGELPPLDTSNFEEQTPQGPMPGATIPPHELDQTPETSADKQGAGANFTPLTSLVPSFDKEGKEDKSSSDDTKSHHLDNLPEKPAAGFNPIEPVSDPLPISKGSGPKKRSSKILLWVIGAILAAFIAAYLAVDAGLIKSDVNLPFHIFNKQKKSTTSTPNPAPTTQNSNPISQPPSQSAIPEGFTKYDVADAGMSFAYPTAWGDPTVTKDPGFSKRGGVNKSDGTHAYIVDFAANKDVEVAFTSSKYLPAARTVLYYDFLQWCVGTNDGKLYKQMLKSTTDANKIDTPGTITCDQGPLMDAVKLDDTTTIFQQKTKDAAGALLGDLYTRNLAGKDLTVMRIKDSQSKNADDIKKLITTVKIDASATATGTNTSPVSTGQ